MEHAARLKRGRIFSKIIGAHVLRELVRGLAELTGGSVSIFEMDGAWVATRTVSPWCRLLRSASLALTGTRSRKQAMASRRWHWYESSWYHAARPAIETGGTHIFSACPGGLNVCAVPVMARREPAGALTYSYGEPPLDASRLREIAGLYGLDPGVLKKKACLHRAPSGDFIEAASLLSQSIAALMGEIYARVTNGEEIQETLYCLRRVLENVFTCTRVIDRDHKIVDLLRYGRLEKRIVQPGLLNEFCYAVSHHRSSPCTLGKVQCPLKKIIKTHKPVKIEHIHKDRQGQDIVAEIQAFPIFDPKRQVEKIIAVEQDISAQKQVEEALRDAEQLYRKEYQQTLRLKDRLEEMTHYLITAQEEERKRLSRELHNSISQDLTAAKIMLERTLLEYKKEGKIKLAQLEDSLKQLEHIMEGIRDIISGLRPPSLDEQGLISTLRLAARHFSARFGIKVIPNLDVSERQIPEKYKINIYRIVQEALHNVAKYARATEVRLSLTADKSHLKLAIADNGLGFDVEKVLQKPVGKRGFGLASIKERVTMLGGTCSFESRPGQGTTVRIRFPIEF